MQAQWEEKLAAYVRTAFSGHDARNGRGQNAIQYVSKLTTAALLLFGAMAVIDGDLTVGAARRLQHDRHPGDAADPAPVAALAGLPAGPGVGRAARRHSQHAARAGSDGPPRRCRRPRGAIEFRNVTFRYRPDAPDVLKNVSLAIGAGEVIGIVGPSGSGKSTLTKLVQRLYIAERRAGPARRRGPRAGRSGLAAPPYRRRAAGKSAVQPHHPRQHRLRQSGDAARPGHRHRPARRRGRVHRQAAAGLRHDDRGARRQSLRRPAPAHRHRARAGDQSADPHLRRGDLSARL